MNGVKTVSSDVEFYADSLLPKRSLVLESVRTSKNGRLEVTISDQVLKFPVDWLRQNCECKKCFNPICLSYISLLKTIVYGDLQLASAIKVEDGRTVTCTFSDGHISEFAAEWLYNRRMTEDGRKERMDNISLHKTVAWPDPAEMIVKKATYAEVTEEMSGFEFFGDNLIKDGIFVITDAPDEFLSEDFGEKTGVVRTNNYYGYDWIIKNEPTPTNHAYTNAGLELHIDEPCLISSPNIQLLHCMVQSENGGENVMSDGIKAANILRTRNPDAYKTLTTTLIQYEDVISHKDKPQIYVRNSSPTINLDRSGEPEYIQYNHACHSSFFDGTPDQYEEVIKALKEFYKILYECSITIKSKPGDILVFDNRRVLHGRLAYESTEARQLDGWYLDWDSVYSKLRVTKIKKVQSASQC